MTYKAETKDDEVWDIADVKVKKEDLIPTASMLTLREIDRQLDTVNTHILQAEKEKAILEEQRAAVLIEAEKVKLKENPNGARNRP